MDGSGFEFSDTASERCLLTRCGAEGSEDMLAVPAAELRRPPWRELYVARASATKVAMASAKPIHCAGGDELARKHRTPHRANKARPTSSAEAPPLPCAPHARPSATTWR